MRRAGNAIVSCAVTGSIHTSSMPPCLPVTPQQIAESAIRAAKAGPAVSHLYPRAPKTGRLPGTRGPASVAF
jgi:uncharacterized protein (DUF849 family)